MHGSVPLKRFVSEIEYFTHFTSLSSFHSYYMLMDVLIISQCLFSSANFCQVIWKQHNVRNALLVRSHRTCCGMGVKFRSRQIPNTTPPAIKNRSRCTEGRVYVFKGHLLCAVQFLASSSESDARARFLRVPLRFACRCNRSRYAGVGFDIFNCWIVTNLEISRDYIHFVWLSVIVPCCRCVWNVCQWCEASPCLFLSTHRSTCGRWP